MQIMKQKMIQKYVFLSAEMIIQNHIDSNKWITCSKLKFDEFCHYQPGNGAI